MATGTISDLDPEGLFGVIDADDGRLVLFNLRGVDPPLRANFQVGTRVQFLEQASGLAPRAQALSVTQGASGKAQAGLSSAPLP